jgi:plasmid stability protein
MAQTLIRNLDDELLADYREAARQNKRSLEAELRDALRRARPLTSPARRRDMLARLAAVRAMTPDRLQTPSEKLVREDRDAGH